MSTLNQMGYQKVVNDLREKTGESIEQIEQEIADLQKRTVYYKTITTTFNRQVLEANKVCKYYSENIQWNTIDPDCDGVSNISMEGIPLAGQHLVITFYCGSRERKGPALVEIYQYQSSQDITSNLNNAKLQITYTKG